MPKKFQGENSKSADARARQNAKKVEESERKKQEKEDEYWKDDDKSLLKKQQRKDEREQKKQNVVEKKQQAKVLLEQEMESLTGSKTGPTKKVTQAEIQAEQDRIRIAREKEEEKTRLAQKKIVVDHEEELLQENINRIVVDGDEARTIGEAIQILNVDESSLAADKHPEKRLKSAYAAFEEQTMKRLKDENPTLRLSQLKQLLKKEWLKSPENPLNQNA